MHAMSRFWDKQQRRVALLTFAAGLTVYFAVRQPHEIRLTPLQEATGLSSPEKAVTVYHTQPSLRNESVVGGVVGGIVGGVPGGVAVPSVGGTSAIATESRQVVRTANLSISVSTPRDTTEKIRVLAERLGGYVLSSQLEGTEEQSQTATVTIDVPAARFEEARTELKRFATQVESDATDAADVTKQYVDMQSNLRNARAEEAQYLAILKRAVTVKDILQVTEQLNDVRNRIEQLQGEFKYLSHQVSMASITVKLSAETQAQIFGIRWRPIQQIKVAAHESLQNLADYFAAIVGFVLSVPVILLWGATITFLSWLGWVVLRWVAKTIFHFGKPAVVDNNHAD